MVVESDMCENDVGLKQMEKSENGGIRVMEVEKLDGEEEKGRLEVGL